MEDIEFEQKILNKIIEIIKYVNGNWEKEYVEYKLNSLKITLSNMRNKRKNKKSKLVIIG